MVGAPVNRWSSNGTVNAYLWQPPGEPGSAEAHREKLALDLRRYLPIGSVSEQRNGPGGRKSLVLSAVGYPGVRRQGWSDMCVGRPYMGLGTSLVVFAVGAVLRLAVSVDTTGFNIHWLASFS